MAKNLFVMNPEIADKKVVIYGTDTKSLLLFSVFLQNDIYVECFADPDNSNKNIKLMNKPICNLADLEAEKDSFILAVSGLDKSEVADKLESLGYDVYFDYNEAAYAGDSILL